MITPTPPKINLTLEKSVNILDGLKLIEIVNVNLLDEIINSEKLMEKWNKNNYSHYLASQLYQNEKHQLTELKKKIKNNVNQGKYKIPKHGWGRPFVVNSLGFTSLRSKIRNTLMKGIYTDFDIENAQPCILKNICDDNNIECPHLNYYINNREECLTLIISNFSVDRKIAKKLFLRIFFKGCLSNWCKDFGLVYKKIDYIENLQKELDTIAKKFKKDNEALYISAKNQKENKGEKNIIGSFFALYLQEYETRIVGNVIYYIINNTKLSKLKNIKGDVVTYEYDGIKLISKNVALFGGLEKVISFLNNKTKELTGFNLNWINKEIEDFYTFAGISNDNLLLNCYDDNDIVDNDDIDEDVDKELKNAVDYITKITSRYQMGIAEEVYKRNPNFFVFNDGNWICWDVSINKWVISNEPLKHLLFMIFYHILKIY